MRIRKLISKVEIPSYLIPLFISRVFTCVSVRADYPFAPSEKDIKHLPRALWSLTGVPEQSCAQKN